MTREKKHQVDLVKGFVDTIHQYQRATNNSLFWGSPGYGISRVSIPEFDLTLDRKFTRGWPINHDTWEIEITTLDVLVSVQVITPMSVWFLWEDLPTMPKAKWTVEIAGDVNCLSEVSTWLKLNWPID